MNPPLEDFRKEHCIVDPCAAQKVSNPIRLELATYPPELSDFY